MKVTLTNGFIEPFDNSVAAARTCYSSRIITAEEVRKDERARRVRDRIAQETYLAGHHTILQHATFQFAIEGISRQAIWSFLHSHPFYNSEQVSQRYVEVKPGNVIAPSLPEPESRRYRETVEAMVSAYQKLIALLTPKVSEHYFEIFRTRGKSPEKWSQPIKKKAQEIARYVLPLGTFAHLYHTVSGITLHRYHRLSSAFDVPTETRALVDQMVAEVRKIDPLFFEQIEDPMPLEATLEHQALASHGGVRVGGAEAKAHRREFDEALGGAISKLVDWGAQGEASVARGVRSVLGLSRERLSDEAALEQVLSPAHNPYLSEALVLTTASKLTRALGHAHYTFQKKLSHTADSQDQRHRMTPGSRPILHTQFTPGEVDVIEPPLIAEVPEAEALFRSTCERSWRAVEDLLSAGVPAEHALYLLPNAFPIRFHESGDLLHFHHKWVHRLCYTAQEEIWRASLEEVSEVAKVHPRIARWIAPPCTLRRQAKVTPFCPEGPRYCGVPVWNLDLPKFERRI